MAGVEEHAIDSPSSRNVEFALEGRYGSPEPFPERWVRRSIEAGEVFPRGELGVRRWIIRNIARDKFEGVFFPGAGEIARRRQQLHDRRHSSP